MQFANRVRNMIRGTVTLLLLGLNLVACGTPFLLIALVKVAISPFARPRRAIVLLLAEVAELWVGINNAIYRLMLKTEWDIDLAEGLRHDGRYLIIANHQSWTDILVVLKTFHRKTPFIRFFLKQELIWVPIVGQACWGLEFPFMKRYTADYLELHPEKRGTDLETTRRACVRYQTIPVSILNFLEGTRFTRDKHEEQSSPHRHLLRPRAGGVAYVVASLGEQLDAVLDVTIAYPGARITLWRFVSNRVPRVVVRIRKLELPAKFVDEAVTRSSPLRDEFKQWVKAIWSEKDALLTRELERATSIDRRREESSERP